MKNNDLIEILLVEDNPNDAELALRAFRKNNIGNNICWVKDGLEALDLVMCREKYEGRDTSNYPKLILLDLKLPKMSGLELLRTLKSKEKTKFIPIVVLTSSKEEKDVINSYMLGVNSYVVKPVKFEDFIKIVSDLVLYWMTTNKLP